METKDKNFTFIDLSDVCLYNYPKFTKDSIKLVRFNKEKGVTVIKWSDNSVTKVKVQEQYGDKFDPETGMAMCICKKVFGNTGRYNEVFKQWLPQKDEVEE